MKIDDVSSISVPRERGDEPDVSSIRICKLCLKKISDAGEFPLSLYTWMCSHHSDSRTIFIRCNGSGNGDTVVRFLEINGYIVTTEIENDLLIAKPTGHFVVNGVNGYCSFRGKHGR